MRSHWVYSDIGKRVMSYTLDPRPVWFWDQDGSRLLWRNLAARLFRSKAKKKRVKLLPDPVPLKGQVSRLIRLGGHGRASLSRMRFQIGKKPVSTTCSCIPLIDDELTGLLVISSDAIDPQLFGGDAYDLAASAQMFEPELDFVVVDHHDEIVAGARVDQAEDAELSQFQIFDVEPLKNAASAQFDISARAKMYIFEPDALDALNGDDVDELSADDQLIPIDATPDDSLLNSFEAIENVREPDAAQQDSEPQEADDENGETPADLTNLIDHLYKSGEGLNSSSEKLSSIEAETMIDDRDADFDDEETTSTPVADAPQLWTIRASTKQQDEDVTGTSESVASEADNTMVAHSVVENDQDRSARYNFEELSRVLRERVETSDVPPKNAPKQVDTEVERVAKLELREPLSEGEASIQMHDHGVPENAFDAPANPLRPKNRNGKALPSTPEEQTVSGALVALSDETLVLNRLPLGILLFRDQELLFANRAMAELAGYQSSTELRQAGFDQLFPRADHDDASVGPVTKLLRKDGSDVAVVARLQSTTWQGKSAYMLTAREDERSMAPIALTEAEHTELSDDELDSQFILEPNENDDAINLPLMIRLAHGNNQGLIALDNRGHVIEASDIAVNLIGPRRELMLERTLVEYIDAETRSNYFGLLAGTKQEADVRLFAGAQHCLIHFVRHPLESGDHFRLIGTVQADEVLLAAPIERDQSETDIGEVLPLLSREIRRPLATISGFNSLMRDEAYGPIGNDRYKEYVKDIHRAARQLERVVSELDDLSRYRNGEFSLETAQIDLGEMLTKCLGRIRGQANAQQVFVRSAIPDQQYMIEADEKLLTQTIMNLLASAVTLTPPGGNVIISALQEEDQSLIVHVRDNGDNNMDRGDKFVVFHAEQDQGADTSKPSTSAVGLSLTHSLAKANAFSLSLDPMGEQGMMMELRIPHHLVSRTTS